MDRALKERLTGAIVLVVVAVLVVPVFLDGPPADTEMVTETLSLPGQGVEGSERKTITLERNRSEPVPVVNEAASKPEPEKPTPAVVQKQADVVAKTLEEVAPKVEEAATTGMWAVQLGSFSNHENARRLATDLRKAGYAAFESKLMVSGSEQVRVRVGPLKDRAAADAMAAKLVAAGYKARVVSHP